MVLSYSSTEFIRFNAIMAFLSMSRYIPLLGLGGTSLQFPLSFPTLSSLIYSLLAGSYFSVQIEIACCFWGLLAVMTFEITFLGSGVLGWIIDTSKT